MGAVYTDLSLIPKLLPCESLDVSIRLLWSRPRPERVTPSRSLGFIIVKTPVNSAQCSCVPGPSARPPFGAGPVFVPVQQTRKWRLRREPSPGPRSQLLMETSGFESRPRVHVLSNTRFHCLTLVLKTIFEEVVIHTLRVLFHWAPTMNQ